MKCSECLKITKDDEADIIYCPAGMLIKDHDQPACKIGVAYAELKAENERLEKVIEIMLGGLCKSCPSLGYKCVKCAKRGDL